MNISPINVNGTPPDKDASHNGGSDYTDRDVLNGRGNFTSNHPGNKHFRNLISQNKERYQCALLNVQKRDIAENIYNSIHDQQGRFMKCLPRTNTWVQMSRTEALLKISSAFRSVKHQANKKKVSAASTLLALQQQATPGTSENTSDGLNTCGRPLSTKQLSTTQTLPLHNQAKFTRKLYYDYDCNNASSWDELLSRVLPNQYAHRIISIYAFHTYPHIHKLVCVPNKCNKTKRVYKCASCEGDGK